MILKNIRFGLKHEIKKLGLPNKDDADFHNLMLVTMCSVFALISLVLIFYAAYNDMLPLKVFTDDLVFSL